MKKLIGLFATILLFAASASAQIEGRVVDVKGKGQPNVTITATGEDGAVASTATTDEDGNYMFEDLDDGSYKITAKGTAAFQPAVRENVNAAEDETTTLNITLVAFVPAPVTKPAFRPTALIGVWDLTVTVSPGQDLPGTLKLEMDKVDAYKGSATFQLGESQLKNIKVKDDSFTADTISNVQGQKLEGYITGKLKDGKLTGEVYIPGIGPIPYSGKKQ